MTPHHPFHFFKNLSLLLTAILLGSCQNAEPKQQTTELGIVSLEVTGAEAALPHFEKGLLLLHSFEYEDAREEFVKAKEADPTMPMAYWGEAMTHNHTIWGEQDFEDGQKTLNQLDSATVTTEITALEKDFIKAVKILYKAETPKPKRDLAYSEYLKELHEKYPKNHEVAAFYALSLLGSVPEGRDLEIYGQAAKIAQTVIDQNPKHPGAVHYLIHSYDDPDHAKLALNAANTYADVAPAASHALHMPSHIYVALGMWDEVVTSNEASYQASVDRMKAKNLDNSALGYHAYHWLMYGYLQQGRIDTARQLLLDMQKLATESPSKRARVHLVFLKGTYMVETNTWDGSIAEIPVDVSDLNVAIAAQYNFLEGMKAFKAGDKTKLEESIAAIDKDCRREALLLPEAEFKVCASSNRSEASKTDIGESRVMEYQLRGLLAWMDNNSVEAEDWLKKSVDADQKLSYSFGPPFIKYPTHELYAEWLLENNKPKEAEEQYHLALKRGPKRAMAEKGLEIAKKAQTKTATL